MASKSKVVQLRASRAAGEASEADVAVESTALDGMSLYVTPQSSLVVTRNSRGYGYELKIFVDDPFELLDPDLLLDQIKAFDKRFRALFAL